MSKSSNASVSPLRRTESDETGGTSSTPSVVVPAVTGSRPHASSFDEFGLGVGSLLSEDRLGKFTGAQTLRKVLSPVLPQSWSTTSPTGAAEGVSPLGLHVAFGSRTRRGLHHANEDRHAITVWSDWVNSLENVPPVEPPSTTTTTESALNALSNISYPSGQVFVPSTAGSSRRETSVAGMGSTDVMGSRVVSVGGSSSDNIGSSTHSGAPKDTAVAPGKRKAYMWIVCDGHDGPQAADYVCRELGSVFSKLWINHLSSSAIPKSPKPRPAGQPSPSAQPPCSSECLAVAYSPVLARAFETVDAQFRAAVNNVEGTLHSCTAGSCATAVFLVGDVMCCAGLGDCKAAVLTLEEVPAHQGLSAQPVSPGLPKQQSPKAADNTGSLQQTSSPNVPKPVQQFQVTWFSKDHRSSSPKERARIKAKGGWFVRGRVGGVLEPTRTIGDFDVKDSQPPGVVIATPEVRTYTVQRPALVVIATDGVWDVMDAAQLLKTLKQRKRLWKSVLAWLGGPAPERRSLRGFGFRRRAKSKEGFEGIFQTPTGGDLTAMAETIVCKAQDLGSDDDCTCMVVFVRPPMSIKKPEGERKYTSDSMMPTVDEDEDEQLLSPQEANAAATQTKGHVTTTSTTAAAGLIGDGFDDEEDDDEDDEEPPPRPEPALPPPEEQEQLMRVESQYEKWHISEEDKNSGILPPADPEDEDISSISSAAVDDFSTACFPLSFFPILNEIDTQFPSQQPQPQPHGHHHRHSQQQQQQFQNPQSK